MLFSHRAYERICQRSHSVLGEDALLADERWNDGDVEEPDSADHRSESAMVDTGGCEGQCQWSLVAATWIKRG
jgi:hypothetical protein